MSDILDPQCFTQENALLYSESYIFDKVVHSDGVQRLKNFKKIFSSEKEIDSLINDKDITDLDQHYVVSQFTPKGWVGSLVKVRIYMAPVTTLTYVDEIQEIEEEEEYQEKIQIRTTIPGKFWGSTYKVEEAVVSKKRPVKRTVTITKPVETTKMERIASSQELLTITLARKEVGSLEIDDKSTPFIANHFSSRLEGTKSFKSIQNGVLSLSKLKEQNPKEFASFSPAKPRLQNDRVEVQEEFYRPPVITNPTHKPSKPKQEYTSLASLSFEIAEIARNKLAKILE
jgi:hypothetical protein